jgi:hypothetical protein
MEAGYAERKIYVLTLQGNRAGAFIVAVVLRVCLRGKRFRFCQEGDQWRSGEGRLRHRSRLKEVR